MNERIRAAAISLLALAVCASPALAADTTWREAGQTATEHNGHTATRLYDGTVLVIGGRAFNGAAPGAVELYDPAANRWTTLPSTATPRADHAAVRLDDGRVLVVGGSLLSPDSGPQPLATAELFDPKARTWSGAAPMLLARSRPVAILLGDGRVLVAGGGTGGEVVTSEAELYDPVANRWQVTAPMSTPRVEASAVRLRTGRVLVAGGVTAAENQDGTLTSAELYDAGSGAWLPAGDMASPHASAPIGLLADGNPMVVGGFDFQGGFGLSTAGADIYDPQQNRWRATTPLRSARGGAGGDVLTDGSFLVVGGFARFGISSESTAEVYDPSQRTWTLLPRLPDPRVAATVTALAGGGALVVGGSRQQVAEVFVPSARAREGPATVAAAVAQNRPLAGLTLLLLLAVAGQYLWRRARAG